MNHVLDGRPIECLLTTIKEAAWSTEKAIERFVEPAPGTLRHAPSKRHHVVNRPGIAGDSIM